jgi:cytochrome P450
MGESLGDEYDPLGSHLDDPFPFYARAQREMPVFFSSKLGVWIVTQMADVKRVLREERTFSSVNSLRPLEPLSMEVLPVLFSGYPLVPVFVVMDGEQHARKRHPWSAGFEADRVAAVRPYLEQRAEALADDLAASGASAEFMATYANPLTVSVACHMIGFAPEHHHEIGENTRHAATLAMGHYFVSEEEQVEAAQAWVRTQQLLGGYVSDRRAAPRDDLISEVIAAYAPGGDPLTEDEEAELVGSLFGVTLAGHITPSAVLGAGLLQLLDHPEQWRLLCDRPELIPNAAEEIIRFCAPTHIFLRQTIKSTVLGGQELPAGAEIAVCPAAANRDETVFSNPGEFDITRASAGSHVTFGHGPHYCLGAGLGRLELTTTLRILTERFPGLHVVSGRPATWRPSLVQRGPAAAFITW